MACIAWASRLACMGLHWFLKVYKVYSSNNLFWLIRYTSLSHRHKLVTSSPVSHTDVRYVGPIPHACRRWGFHTIPQHRHFWLTEHFVYKFGGASPPPPPVVSECCSIRMRSSTGHNATNWPERWFAHLNSLPPRDCDRCRAIEVSHCHQVFVITDLVQPTVDLPIIIVICNLSFDMLVSINYLYSSRRATIKSFIIRCLQPCAICSRLSETPFICISVYTLSLLVSLMIVYTDRQWNHHVPCVCKIIYMICDMCTNKFGPVAHIHTVVSSVNRKVPTKSIRRCVSLQRISSTQIYPLNAVN